MVQDRLELPGPAKILEMVKRVGDTREAVFGLTNSVEACEWTSSDTVWIMRLVGQASHNGGVIGWSNGREVVGRLDVEAGG